MYLKKVVDISTSVKQGSTVFAILSLEQLYSPHFAIVLLLCIVSSTYYLSEWKMCTCTLSSGGRGGIPGSRVHTKCFERLWNFEVC